MGIEAAEGGRRKEEKNESVIVVMDGNRRKGRVDALEWALKHVVRGGDMVIALGVLCHFGKKTSICFPSFNIGLSISGIWEKLEFSSQGQEVRPRELGEEIERKREQYHNIIQPFYRRCKRNQVKLEVKLAVGFCPKKITIEQAQNFNPRWIVLDSHLKKHKMVIYQHVGCNIAVLKGKDVATLMPSRALQSQNTPHGNYTSFDDAAFATNQSERFQNDLNVVVEEEEEEDEEEEEEEEEGQQSRLPVPSQSPTWYPLSWRNGYPRAFSQSELELITKGFSEEMTPNCYERDVKVYEGMLQETPVLVKSFSENDERFWTMLKILSRIRHRNIMNLVGYCCTGTNNFLLSDFPCMGTLEMNLQYDELARKLPWKARWYIAMEIGGSLRYLHEECVDGTIVHLSLSSTNVVFSHGCTTMLGNFTTARLLKHDAPSDEDRQTEWENTEKDECVSIDVRDYGIFLVELISGKSARLFQSQSNQQPFIDWALPQLEKGAIRSELMDPRVMDINDSRVVQHMANAALLCLNHDSTLKLPMSLVLAVVRGDQLAMPKC